MLLATKRQLLAATGGVFGAALVALVEARSAEAGGAGVGYGALALADFGVLAPVCAFLGFAVGLVHLAIEPGVPESPTGHVARLRSQPVLARTRTAALVPIVIVVGFAVVVAVANAARSALAEGQPAESGALASLASIGFVGVGAVTSLALLAPLRKVLAEGSSKRAWLIDPAKTGAIALALTIALFAFGVRAGDVGGDGAWPLGIFGVLGRAELDLRPVVDAMAVVVCAYLAPVAFAQRAFSRVVAFAALAACAASAGTIETASAMNQSAALTRSLEKSAPLGHLALAVVRRATDRDKDGASPFFGGGDCDDRDPRRSPLGLDVPGNGVDEDCSGADTPLPKPAVVEPPAKKTIEAPPDLNLVLITVDTLRPDVGFMGYDKPTTPNLDALAKKAVVFDHAYSLASYTGKSIGPLLIGKYPSETDRDGGHFNKYAPSNTFVAERLRAEHVHTMGAASHWYFAPWSGLSQGIDTWDLSAKPQEGQGDNDTSVTSKELSDAALRMLKKPENTGDRFFMWLHYFDPHEQYMPHDGAPDFTGGQGSVQAVIRARYDGEVWFTDQQIGRVLDFIASQPWGDKTAIIVTSDHGEAFGEHDMSWHGVELWECLVHVPWIIYVPGNTPHHVVQKRSHIDMAPTILDVMHVKAPPGELSGRSLLSDVLGEGPYEERDVFIDMPVGPYTLMRKAIITGKTPGTKLIYSGGKNYQVFDLATDPDEGRDLSGDPSVMSPMLESFERARGGLSEIEVKPDAP